MTSPCYLLIGEPFLSGEGIDRIRNESGADPLSEIDLDTGSSPAEILSVLDTPSLFGGARVVIVRDADGLSKEQREAVIGYLDSPNPETVLVLVGESARNPLVKPVERAGGTVVSLEPPKGRRLVAWLRERAGARNLRLDERAAWALIDAVGPELRDLDGAIEQLSTALGADAVAGAAEIRRVFPRLADERIYALTDALGERKLAVAMTALRRLTEQDQEPLVIFGALSAHVRRLLIARAYVDAGPRAVAEALGLPEWRAKRVHKQARSYREDELLDAVQLLAATDLEIKGGDLPPEAALERAVIQIIAGRQAATTS